MEKNRRYSSRRTTVPTLLQSLLVCQHCGYALYRAWSQNTQGRKTYYYRCPGTDAHRRAQGTVCHNRPLRQDALDQRVWEEVVRLLQDPTLMQTEIQRRQDEASKADPHRQRQELVSGQQARLHNQITRLFDAYQEGLIPWEEFRPRMVELRRQQQALQAELQSLHMAAQDQSRYLRLVETLSEFRTRLCLQSEILDVQQRQKIVRLLVKEVLVGSDSIVIRHSIPIARCTPGTDPSQPPADTPKSPAENYLLRTCHRDKGHFYWIKQAFSSQPIPVSGQEIALLLGHPDDSHC
jgi:site-specific DNA recombinase